MHKKANVEIESFLRILLWIVILFMGLGGVYLLIDFLTKTAS